MDSLKRRYRYLKFIAVFVAFSVLFQTFYPVGAFALTSGPSQPEVQGFEPVGTTDMVDLFTGDFTYNIPLLDVGGYPINISYSSGITMDQEASWVGLGWNLNPGAITRNMRGIPDDFNGDVVNSIINLKPNDTWVYSGALGATEIFGAKLGEMLPVDLNLSAGLAISMNSYTGIGVDVSLHPAANINTFGGVGKGQIGMGFTMSSQAGLTIRPNVNFSLKVLEKTDSEDPLKKGIFSLGLSSPINSRQGMKSLILSGSSQGASAFNSSYSAVYSFANPTYIPSGQHSFKNHSFAFTGEVGGELYGVQVGVDATGTYSRQELSSKYENNSAYGHFYLQNSNESENAILDQNREKDGKVTPKTPQMYIPVITNDVFSISGQGIQGTFKTFRKDFGATYDDKVTNTTTDASGGVDFGAANLLKGGVNFSNANMRAESGMWKTNKTGDVSFTTESEVDNDDRPLYEPAYFKMLGEKNVTDQGYISKAGGSALPNEISIGIKNPKGFDVELENKLLYEDNTVASSLTESFSDKRTKRNQQISYLTASEASEFALEEDITSYTFSDASKGTSTSNNMNRVGSYKKSHHLSEMKVTKPDGWRYVYGIPAYNITQEEVTFSVEDDGNDVDCGTGLVDYEAGDDSENNKKGQDWYFNKTILPGYAHSFLLTAVLSPDYVDVTGNGITDDDLGSAVHLKYTRNNSSYNWRAPVGNKVKQANYQEGLKSKDYDDKGSYIYGEKEVWYLHKVESKTHVAEFYTSKRKDGLGVNDAQGGSDSSDANRLMRLDSIKLFAKEDRQINEEHAVPIKTVVFVYDYSLCRGIENRTVVDSGKLTLKEIYFTYGNSKKGRLNSYKFNYSSENPGYNMKSYDRWGYYMENPNDCGYRDPNGNTLSNSDAPYTIQGPVTDSNAEAWHLTQIKLPSGGTINVEYESDDYAYVQDRKAMQMFKIAGFASSPSPDFLSDKLYESLSEQNHYLFFDLDEPMTKVGEYKDKLRGKYLDWDYSGSIADPQLFFRIMSKIKGDKYELIPGYCKVVDVGLPEPGSNTRAYLQLEKVSRKDNNSGKPNTHPMAIAALQFSRIHLNDILNPGANAGLDPIKVIKGLIQFIPDATGMIIGRNTQMMSDKYCQEIDLDKSFVRLNNPTGKKKGGGSRVKKLYMSDNWSGMIDGSHGESSVYGQVYNYEMEGDDGTVISSGVASYEPLLGGEENPFRQPVPFVEDNLLAPDDRFYAEEPFGESYFPSPVVGYSKVTVSDLTSLNVDANKNSTGKTVTEFYTAKEYPTFVDFTSLNPINRKTPFTLRFLKKEYQEVLALSQGYSIELNDMHGKQKSVSTYDRNGTLQTSVEYHFRKDSEGNDRYRLNNKVDVLQPDGTISSEEIGLNVEFHMDTRESFNKTDGMDIMINGDGFIAGVVPFVVPMVWPPQFSEQTEEYAASTIKVIQKYGIVDSIVATDFGSKIVTHNELFDAETGQVVMTQTFNEYDDPVFNLTYPAYFAYDGMGPAYQNDGVKIPSLSTSGGVVDLSSYSNNPSTYFAKGDEIMVFNSSGIALKTVWVYEVYDVVDEVKFIESDGDEASFSNATLKVLRSGRKNLQSQNMGTVTALADPGSGGLNTMSDVVNASAVEYSDEWNLMCYEEPPCESDCYYEGNQYGTVLQKLEELFDSLAAHNEFACADTYPVPLGFSSDYPDYGDVLPDYNSVPFDQEGDHNWDIVGTDASTMTGIIGTNYEVGCAIQFSLQEGFNLPNRCSYGDIWCSIESFQDFEVIANESALEDSCHVGSIYGFKAMANLSGDCGDAAGGQLEITMTSTCFPILTCEDLPHACDDVVSVGSVVNPFLTGLRGNWHPEKSYAFHENRAQGADIDLRSDGTIENFEPFWQVSADIWDVENTALKWVAPAEVTKINPLGQEVENVDALGNYSSALYGYKGTLPVAIASNARYNQIANNNFEDYYGQQVTCEQDHFSFREVNYTLSDEAHTGFKSIKILADTSEVVTRNILTEECTEGGDAFPYEVKGCDCLGLFEPNSSSEDSLRYVVSYWVKETEGHEYNNAYVEIELNGVPVTYASTTKSEIIEGWQKNEHVFEIPKNASGEIDVALVNEGLNDPAYFDDLRIHPFEGNMVTYVYHPETLKLTAQLDNNNFATFYEYDWEGNLVRIKKETERGIVTLQETRQNLTKKPGQ